MVRLGALRVQLDGLRERRLGLVPLLLVGVQFPQRQGRFQGARCRLFSFILLRDDPWVAGPLRCRPGQLEDDEASDRGDQQQPGQADDQAARSDVRAATPSQVSGQLAGVLVAVGWIPGQALQADASQLLRDGGHVAPRCRRRSPSAASTGSVPWWGSWPVSSSYRTTPRL